MISPHRSLVLFALLALPILGSRVAAQPLPSHLLPDERNTIEIFQRTADSVVFIHNVARQQNLFRQTTEVEQGTGSGFVWDEAGHIVTNAHVLQGGSRFVVTFSDGTNYDAVPVGWDENKDLAVLKVDAPDRTFTPLYRGDSDELLVGQKVLAIGNPFGLDQTLTTGVISALDREIRSFANVPITGVVQTDASINPGNSGGPLLDSRGYLIGVNTAIVGRTGADVGIGFAVPVNTVQRIVPQIISTGSAQRAGLGITMVSERAMRRLQLDGVGVERDTRSNFETLEIDRRSGRLRGDIIIGIEGHRISSQDDLYKTLDHFEPGDRVEIEFLRDGKSRKTMRLQLIDVNRKRR